MKKSLLVITFILVFLVGVVLGAAGFYFVVLRQFADASGGGLPAGAEVPTLNPFDSGYQNPFSNVNPFAR